MAKKTKLQKYMESREFITKSECVISAMSTRLKIIDADLSMRYDRQVIHSINSRIKTYESLIAKIQKKKFREMWN